MLIARVTLVVSLLALWLLALRYIPFELPSYGLYASAIVAFVALVCLARPLAVFGLASRRAAAVALGVSLAVGIAALTWPTRRQHTSSTSTLVDQVLPTYDAAERHAVTLPFLALVGRPWDNTALPTQAPDLEAFRQFDEPASVRIAFNFRVAPVPQGTLLTTETRIMRTDTEGARTFGRYWRGVYPGSAVLRQAWLDAVGRRLRNE